MDQKPEPGAASPAEFTQLLHQWRAGDRDAFAAITPLVYQELRQVAAKQMRAENAGHTLQATALVNEAYLRLVDAAVDINDRIHFFAIAARVMRHVLVDHAKAKGRQKRGGDAQRVSLDDVGTLSVEAPSALVELDAALGRLGEFDERKVRVVELIYFAGLTYAETAVALEVSEVTVHRDLKLAKAWLQKELGAP
ncbi:MAG: sigma-70 family RNA polymerase sigma factor [Planctomycetota bacterium]